MIPHRFTALGGGVSMVIGARDADGNITDFFADDPRDPNSHRTYFAHSAIITHDEEGYVLRMRNGAVQYLTADNGFSQVSFDKYDLPLDRLTGSTVSADPIAQASSLELLGTALSTGIWRADVVQALLKRTGEGLRVIAMCLFVAGLALFPTGQRRRTEIPIEFAVLGAAFLERAFTSYVGGPGILGVASGSVLLIGLSLLILLVRLRVFQPPGIRRQIA
jgi:lipopolysaccharide export system permease protein